MLPDYKNQYNVKSFSELEVYCRLEGLDPLYIRSIGEKNRQKPKKIRRALGRLSRTLQRSFKRMHMQFCRII